MDIKSEVEIKEEFFDCSDDDGRNDQSFEQDTGFEQIQLEMYYSKMVVKEEIEIKEEEPEEDIKEEYTENDGHFEQIFGLDESQKNLFCSTIYIKEESEIKDEPDGIKEELAENVENNEQISGFDESQSLISDAGQGKEGSKVKSPSGSRPQTSASRDVTTNLSCPHCNFSFKRKKELKDHLKTHNKRKLKCPHCDYQCNLKSKLERHLLIHSNVKLFKCSDCSYGCNQKRDLKRHIAKRHQEGRAERVQQA